MFQHRWLKGIAPALLALALFPTWTLAQATPAPNWDAAGLQLTRAELQEMLARHEQVVGSSSWSDALKARSKADADLIRRRLAEGDFQVGDQIQLSILGEGNTPLSQQMGQMPMTVSVAPGRKLSIPTLGEIELQGVLRSELQEKTREFVGRFVRNPVVRTTSQIRLAVQGQVGQPSFSVVLPAESILAELIRMAGGTTPNADMAKAHIKRGTDRIWEAEALQKALADGRTLDQMQLRSGDELNVPSASAGRSANVLRAVTIVPGLILAITGLLRLF
jgi:protein involved in polysaccharide export with SLBB domain